MYLYLQHTSTEQALHLPSLLLLNSTTLQRPKADRKRQSSVVICGTASHLFCHCAGLHTPETYFSVRSSLKASLRQEHSFPPTYRKTHKLVITCEMFLVQITDHLCELEEPGLFLTLSGCHSPSSFSENEVLLFPESSWNHKGAV